MTDGSAALKAVARQCPDVALVDLGLPGMNGYELARKLRAGGSCPASMKLVAITGYAADAAALALEGFDSHMTKPIDLQDLERELGSVSGLR